MCKLAQTVRRLSDKWLNRFFLSQAGKAFADQNGLFFAETSVRLGLCFESYWMDSDS